MACDLGWTVRSPAHVTLEPINEFEFEIDDDQLPALSRDTGLSMFWRRGRGVLALPPTPWLSLYRYEISDGHEPMFVPNGEGSLEWRLGWTASVPEGYFLYVLPVADTPAELEILEGVLSATQVDGFSASGGFSIAIRPRARITIGRGDRLARIVLLHRDSLVARASAQDEELRTRSPAQPNV